MNLVSLGLALTSLLSSLWIYAGYRSEDTWVNVLLARMLPTGALHQWREGLHAVLAVPDVLAWRVPGGLWVFAATLLARDLRVSLRGFKVELAFLPLIIALALEFCQALHLTDGAYDPWDITTSLVAAILALKMPGCDWPPQELARAWHWRGSLCLASLAILFLADVHR